MPRKSDERGFGFRADGILRILVAADAEQVLLAVEELGFRLPDRAPIETLGELVTELHGQTEAIIENFLNQAIEFIGDSIDIFQGDHSKHPTIEDDARLVRAMQQFIARRREFTLDLKKKRIKIEEAVTDVADLFPFNLPEF